MSTRHKVWVINSPQNFSRLFVKPLEEKDDGCDLGVKPSILWNKKYGQEVKHPELQIRNTYLNIRSCRV
jgi:hypothetical protein